MYCKQLCYLIIFIALILFYLSAHGQANTPPTITVTQPNGDQTVPATQETFTFTGTASDDDGTVTKVQYQLNGGLQQDADGTTSWSFTIPLAPSTTSVVNIRAVDDDEGRTDPPVKIFITRKRPNNPPSLSVSSPSGDQTIPNNETSIEFFGTANDIGGGSVTEIQYRINSNDNNDWLVVGGNDPTNWQFTAMNLTVGPNSIEVRAKDNDNDFSNVVTRTITRSPPTSEPLVQIVQPIASATIPNSQSSIEFSGIASDADGSITLVQYRVNGGRWEDVTGDLINWSFTATQLSSGSNAVVVRARDNNFNFSPEVRRTITRQTGSNSPPTVTITDPASDITVPNSQTSIQISGTATDNNGTVTDVEVRVNDAAFEFAAVDNFTAGNWSTNVTLMPNFSNEIEIRARDNNNDLSTIVKRTITVGTGVAPFFSDNFDSN